MKRFGSVLHHLFIAPGFLECHNRKVAGSWGPCGFEGNSSCLIFPSTASDILGLEDDSGQINLCASDHETSSSSAQLRPCSLLDMKWVKKMML